MTVDGASAETALFVELVVPELDLLLRVAKRVVARPADAEDLVQETVLRAFRSIGSFDGAHPRAWLLTILRNTHINQHRRRRPRLLGAREDADELPAPAADAAFDGAFDEAIVDALNHLSVRHRAVVNLVDIEGLSYAEAAAALAVPIGTIMSRLNRARKQIRDELRLPGAPAAAGGVR